MIHTVSLTPVTTKWLSRTCGWRHPACYLATTPGNAYCPASWSLKLLFLVPKVHREISHLRDVRVVGILGFLFQGFRKRVGTLVWRILPGAPFHPVLDSKERATLHTGCRTQRSGGESLPLRHAV